MLGPATPGGQAQVVILDDAHRVRRQQVTLGLVAGQQVEIAGGLDEGQLVVTGRTSALADGEEVTPSTGTPGGTGATG